MNRKIMKMASVVLVLILAVGMVGAAAAAASNVRFDWQGSLARHGFAFTPDNGDLFQDMKNLMPGDTVTQTITVQNTWFNPVRIWLRCDAFKEDFNPDFLNQLKLTVTANGSEIFDATAGVQDGLAPTEENPFGVLLGTFRKKGTVELTATLEVPIELDSNYMAQTGIVPWTFTAEEVVLPDTPDTGDDFSLWMWVAVAAVLAAGVVVLVMKQRRQRTEN